MSGFFGCASIKECVADVFYGTDYHSHLGTKRAGMAFYNGENFVRSIHSLESAYFRNKFENELPKFAGSKIGIGVISDSESQPVTITSHLGRFSVVTIGRIANINQLAEEMLSEKVHFAELSGSDINATELVAVMISNCSSFEEGIKKVQQKIQGSCSMLILTCEGIYACRDKFGRTPIVIGKNPYGYAIATESSSFPNLDYEFERELGPAEVVFVTAEGIKQVQNAGCRKQVCSFLWVYYGYPSSYFEGVNVEDSRNNNGGSLSLNDTEIAIDFVSGVPDSGIGHAVGYSNARKVDYKRAFVKYTPTWPRSFMPQNQNMRDLVAKMKIIPNKALICGKKMAIMDDSIVRGTQFKDNIVKLREAGVKEIHIRVACPPLVYPCLFLNFSVSRTTFDLYTRRVIRELEGTDVFSDELLAEYADESSEKHAQMIQYMAKQIDADSLKFQKLSDLVKAIGLPKEDLCTHCWDNSSYME
ncbi:MAG: amidophosphoribosyltransferase [Bacteroidales bacterium]|nr:amidophosphoribosyltransferase [Bacteroidales bacterium]